MMGWGKVKYVPTWLTFFYVRGEGGGLGEGKICAYLAETPLCQR